jgi:hydroxymethylpyrimidine/phosphomethylpyrimidine kinase
MQHKCLSIAGFDGSGGAGIQADLKTFGALGCYGMTVLTALPVQNTCGVRNCYDIPLACIAEQLEAIFDDITPDSIKIGMLFSAEIIELLAEFLNKHGLSIPIILDPVMVAKSGDPLLLPTAITALRDKILPLATIVTPNLPEAMTLAMTKKTDAKYLASKVIALGAKSVLVKGGHGEGDIATDYYLDMQGLSREFHAKRVLSENTHGTGCTLSAAIAAYTAQGHDIMNSCELAKNYLLKAIIAAKDSKIGRGHGPVHHFHHL